MKKTNYYIIGLLFTFLCIFFSSCTDDNKNITPPVIAPEGEGFLSINLSTLLSPTTKGPINEIDPWEHRVNEVWILLYNEKDVLEYKYELKVKNYKDSPLELVKFYNTEGETIVTANAETLKLQSVAQSIKRQQYKMAVLANPPADIFQNLKIEVDSDLSDLTDAIGGGLNELTINKFGGYEGEATSPLFFMSNANGLVTVRTTDLYPTKEEALTNPVQVNIDRLLAKVAVKEREAGVIITTKDVILDTKRPVRWYLDVTNKSTFLIRQFAHLEGGTEAETEENSLLDRERIYAKDPNYLLSENNVNNFNTWDKGDVAIPYATWISKNAADPALKTYQYVFENTFDKETQKDKNWPGYSTRIVLKVHLIYKNLLWDPNDIDNEDDPNRNYYSYLLVDGTDSQWRIFTQEQAAHWLDRGFPYIEKVVGETPTEEAARLEENRWVALLEAKIKKIQTDYTNNVNGAFNFAVTQHPGTDEKFYSTYDGVTYHPLGLNYYNIPVRHFGSSSGATDPKEVYGYYGVVRNNMYTVTINSISGPGNGIYDWDSRFLSADISITKWYKRKQIVDLGYKD